MKFILIFLCLLSTGITEEAQELQGTQEPQTCNCSHLLNAEKELAAYPTIPSTSFNCWNKYDGYYADVDVDCTIFHYCQTWHYPTGLNETVKWDFACPEGTIFNQKILSCTEPGVSFECKESPDYYWVNYILTATPNPATNTNCKHHVGIEGQSAEFSNSNQLATGSSMSQSPFHFENIVNTTPEGLPTDISFPTEISHQQYSETNQLVGSLAPLDQDGSSPLPLSPDPNFHTYSPFSSPPQDQLLQNSKETPDSFSNAEQSTIVSSFHNSQEPHSDLFSQLDEFQSSTSFPESVFSTNSQESVNSESFSSTGNLELNSSPSESSVEHNFEETQAKFYTKPPANSGAETSAVVSDDFSQFPTVTNSSAFSSAIHDSESNNFQSTQSGEISAINGILYNEIVNSSFPSNDEPGSEFFNHPNNSGSEYEESDLNPSASFINKQNITQQPEPLDFSTETTEHGSGSHQNDDSQSTLSQANEDHSQKNPVDGLNTAHNTPTENNFSQLPHDFESEAAESTISEHSIVFPPSTPTYDDYYSSSYPQPTHGPGSDPIEFPSANSFSPNSRDN